MLKLKAEWNRNDLTLITNSEILTEKGLQLGRSSVLIPVF
jgi:hypothetical protein